MPLIDRFVRRTSTYWLFAVTITIASSQLLPFEQTTLEQGSIRGGTVKDGDTAFLIPVHDDYYDYQRNFRVANLIFDIDRPKEPLEIKIQLRANRFVINQTDVIYMSMPRITSGPGDGTKGESFEIHQFSHATLFRAFWEEGEHTSDHSLPFPKSNLTLQVREGRILDPKLLYEVIIYRSNHLIAQCSWRQDDEAFVVGVNATKAQEASTARPWNLVTRMGTACAALLECSGHGVCDTCRQRCACYEGFGGPINNGTVEPPRDIAPDCSKRTCYTGPVLRGISTGKRAIHQVEVECSDNGICDRATGLCECAPGWEGTSCERRMCPNDCSGHGHCLSMNNLARHDSALPLNNVADDFGRPPLYGTTGGGTWDTEVMFGCVCDSQWAVGLGSGQTQQPEWFGADCSKRHCPTGDDPRTVNSDETNCTGVVAAGGFARGQRGNKCHVDCSNRGRCNFNTGKCSCYEGYYGDNCGLMSVFAKQVGV